MDGDWKKTTAYIAFGIILFLLFYVLSIGPANLIIEKTGMGIEVGRCIYAPIIWLYEHTPLQGPLDSYLDLWHWE